MGDKITKEKVAPKLLAFVKKFGSTPDFSDFLSQTSGALTNGGDDKERLKEVIRSFDGVMVTGGTIYVNKTDDLEDHRHSYDFDVRDP